MKNNLTSKYSDNNFLAGKLLCVKCRSGVVPDADGYFCEKCRLLYKVRGGIVDTIQELMPDTAKEINAWPEFARAEGWSDSDALYLNSLPSSLSNVLKPKDSLGWLSHELNFFKSVEKVSFAGMDVLDLGAGRCWSTRILALLGARCVASDVMADNSVGLGAGEHYMKVHDIYFSRVLATFELLPFKNESFDIVLASGSLHHSVDYERAIAEVGRVLRRGGSFLLVNEPVSSFRGGGGRWG